MVIVTTPALATKIRVLASPKFTNTVFSSSSLAAGTVIGIVPAGLATGYDGSVVVRPRPKSTVNFESSTPLPIVDGAGVVAKPVYSAFQMDMTILKVRGNAAWAVHPGAVALVDRSGMVMSNNNKDRDARRALAEARRLLEQRPEPYVAPSRMIGDEPDELEEEFEPAPVRRQRLDTGRSRSRSRIGPAGSNGSKRGSTPRSRSSARRSPRSSRKYPRRARSGGRGVARSGARPARRSGQDRAGARSVGQSDRVRTQRAGQVVMDLPPLPRREMN